jgi:BNR repeat-like domain
MKQAFLVVLIVSISVGAIGRQQPGNSPFTEIASPAGSASAEPNLSVAPDGRIFFSWLEPSGKTSFLKFSVLGSINQWSAPQTIARGENWFVNWADFPSMIALPDGSLAAHWLARSAASTYAYNVNIAFSRDSGKTWSKPLVPHRDGTQSEHGFVSLLPAPSGGLAAIWLDGRKMTNAGHDTHGEPAGDMSLMFTTISSDGNLGKEMPIDGRVCECCQTSAVRTPDGIAVVYRDRSPQEVRDIFISRYSKGTWSQPENLSKDGWQITGCPVNGPSIYANGNNVAAAWFNAPNEAPLVKVALSKDGARTFGAAVRIDDGNPIGRVDVVALPSGAALVSWLERTDKGAQVRVRRVNADGTRQNAIIVSETSVARSSGFPRMELSGNRVVVAWTDSSSNGRVRTALMKVTP